MTQQRPALAEVLAALTGHSGPPLSAMPWEAYTGRPESMHGCGATTELLPWGAGASLLVSGVKVPFGIARWLHASPAEAVEALATARLWPWDPGDDPTRWWCERCGGSGFMVCDWESGERDFCDRCAEEDPEATGGFRALGHTADPPSHAALVAVASLGAPMLVRYVALAGEIARAAGCEGARVVWRVMGREALKDHDRRTAEKWNVIDASEISDAEDVVGLASVSHRVAAPQSLSEYLAGWASETAELLRENTKRSIPALRSLAVGDDETPRPTGVHLVALDVSRIVLAVEAI